MVGGIIKHMKSIDITGKKYNRLTAVSYIETRAWREKYWLFNCDCGEKKIMRKKDVTQGKSLSCGCLHKEIVTTHGMHKSRIYKIWHAMKDRCNNVNNKFFKDYGGRGIKVCDRWNDFSCFFNDMSSTYQDDLTLDRINVDGNYEKNNCRWANATQQQRNRRDSVKLIIDGIEISLYEVAESLSLNPKTISKRLHRGWSHEKAIKQL